MPLILPLIALLFWFDTYRPSTTQPPIWGLRTFWNMGQGHTIVDFGPFVAGMAAWIGSRDGRRGMADLITAAARPRWAAQLAAWAATAIWAVRRLPGLRGRVLRGLRPPGRRGVPPWWWVAVGATAVTAFSAAGFAVGAFFPSRFAAPLAAFGGFLAMMMSSQTGFSHASGWALILPTNSNGNFQPVSGIFYPYLPDLPIARIMFLAGIAVAALGLLGLPAAGGGPGLRRAAAVVTLAGVAAAVTAVGLADTARLGPHGMVIPALHDAASDRPIRLHPGLRQVRRGAGVPEPGLRPLPGGRDRRAAPAARRDGRPARRAGPRRPGGRDLLERRGGTGRAVMIGGSPPVLRIPLDTLNTLPGGSGFTGYTETEAQFAASCRRLAVHAFVGAGNGTGTPAQQAVQAALLRSSGAAARAAPGPGRGLRTDRGPRPGPRPGDVAAGRRAGDWPRCRPPPGTPGSPPTCVRCTLGG